MLDFFKSFGHDICDVLVSANILEPEESLGYVVPNHTVSQVNVLENACS